MSNPEFLIRVDASRIIGSGHTIRCLTLANVLKSRGKSVEFVCRPLPGSLEGLIRSQGFQVHMLSEVEEGPLGSVYSEADQQADCQESVRASGGKAVECVIVDHYGLDRSWQRAFRPMSSRIVVVDDIANRGHDCDLLVDQNFSLNPNEKYHKLVSQGCRQLIGPKYALLNDVYANNRSRHQQLGAVQRVFVYFGGTDQLDLTGAVVRTLLEAVGSLLSMDVVIGSSYQHEAQLTQFIEQTEQITLHRGLPHLADLMIRADLAIGAGGGTTWERLCIGLPSIVISVAENQEPAMEALSAKGLICYLGHHKDLSMDTMLDSVRKILADPQSLIEQSRLGMLEVDGLGAHRVAEQLDPSRGTDLSTRLATASDVHLYYSWANDPDVRHMALNTEKIAWRDHERWFSARLVVESTTLLLLCAQGLPVGQIRFDEEGSHTRISYSIDADYRGRNWGKILVGMGMHEYGANRGVVFRAEVKKDNPASAAILQWLGFVISDARSTDEVQELLFDTGHQRLISAEELVNCDV